MLFCAVFSAFHHRLCHSGFSLRHGPAQHLRLYSRAAPSLWTFGTEAAGLRHTAAVQTTTATVETASASLSTSSANALLAGLQDSSSGTTVDRFIYIILCALVCNLVISRSAGCNFRGGLRGFDPLHIMSDPK